MTAPRIREIIMQELDVNLSTSTIKNRLRENNLFGRIARHKPNVSEKNGKTSLAFAKHHLEKPLHYWNNVLFTDESKFNRIGWDGRVYVRRNPNKEHNKNGEARRWGWFSWYGTGQISKIEGTVNQIMYKNILVDHMLPYVEDEMPLRWKLVQDNDPKHTARSIKSWLCENKIDVVVFVALC